MLKVFKHYIISLFYGYTSIRTIYFKVFFEEILEA